MDKKILELLQQGKNLPSPKNNSDANYDISYSLVDNKIILHSSRDHISSDIDVCYGNVLKTEKFKEISNHYINDLSWLSIHSPCKIFKPKLEPLDIHREFAVDDLSLNYFLEQNFDSQDSNKFRSVPLEDFSEGKIAFHDAVALNNLIDDKSVYKAYPKLVLKNKEMVDYSSSDFNRDIFNISKDIASSFFHNIQQLNDNKEEISFLDSELLEIERMDPKQFLSHITENKKEINISTITNSNKKEKSVFVHLVKLKYNNPQFEAIRENMAFTYSFELDPFQKEAIVLLEQQQNVFVSAHTSAGKTVIAEYAIALSLKHGMKAIYTSPIKALSNQKYRDFTDNFNSVGIVTGDVQINADASCLIMTTEILRVMLFSDSRNVSFQDVEWIIFDEVHYINDEDRGVVWEELLILLPRNIKLVLLSATFPNYMDFANWVGSTREQMVNVILTLKRPVPLEHHLFYAKNRQNLDNCQVIVDKNGVFQKNVVPLIRSNLEEKKKPSFLKRVRENNQKLNLVLEYLDNKKNMPVIFFIFSKKRCLDSAMAISNQDFTTNFEKSEIHHFFNKCISRLSPENLELNQIKILQVLLEKGIAVHHSGILPILREIVELLFQKSLIKVLFATETFSIGVNMPAKTVVFSSLKKPCKTGHRYLYPSEYIQMAGRAGRRGKDLVGTVIIIYDEDSMEMCDIQSIINGEPFLVKSQFFLSYGMLLRMLGKKCNNELKIEDLMRASFSEFSCTLGSKIDFTDKINSLNEEKSSMSSSINGCFHCPHDLNILISDYIKSRFSQTNVIEKIMQSYQEFSNYCKDNKIVVIQLACNQIVLGVIFSNFKKLLVNKNQNIDVLVFIPDCLKNLYANPTSINERTVLPLSKKNLENLLSNPINGFDFPSLLLTFKDMFASDSSVSINRCYYINIKLVNILYFFDRNIKFGKNFQKTKIDTKGQNIFPELQKVDYFKEIIYQVEEIYKKCWEIPILCGLQQVDDFKNPCYGAIYSLANNLENFKSIKCSEFEIHVIDLFKIKMIEEELKNLNYQQSDESLRFLPEYNGLLKILKNLEFLDEDDTLTFKGKISFLFRNQFEIILTELMLSKEFCLLDPEFIAVILSCFLNDFKPLKEPPPPMLSEELNKLWNMVVSIEETVRKEEENNNINYEKRYISPQLILPVYKWTQNVAFSEIVKEYDIDEGSWVRNMLRLNEMASEMEKAALFSGNHELKNKISILKKIIHRDIVFTPSLYLVQV